MNLTGKHLAPVIFFWILISAASLVKADEFVYYSLPEEKVNESLEAQLRWQVPQRQWLFLNGDWQIKHPESGDVLGVMRVPCTFRSDTRLLLEKKFDLRKLPQSQFVLNLGEMNGFVKVRVNDHLLYDNLMNYYPVSLPVDPAQLKNGENLIHIEITRDARRFGDVPGFYPILLPQVDTGILRGIYLEIRSGRFVEQLAASATVADSQVTLQGAALLNQPLPAGRGYQVQVAYQSNEKTFLNQIFPINQDGVKEVALPPWPADARVAWQPGSPGRYWVEVTIDSAGKVLDRYRQPLALRSSEIRGNELLWNGKPVYINGINYVYQTMEGSQLFDPALVRNDLEEIKRRGFNAVRVILHPLPEQFYALCDEVGLLCFQDLPFVYWGKNSVNNPARFRRWLEYCQRMRKLAGRYNSIAAAGMAFYLDNSSIIQRRRLNSVVREVQDFPVPFYSSTLIPGEDVSQIVDFQLVDALDRNHLGRELARIEKALAGTPGFLSGYAKAISYRVDSTTVTHDLLQLSALYEKVREKPKAFRGHFIPTYADYYLYLPSIQNGRDGQFYLNRVGLVSIDRVSREVSDSFRNIREFTTPLGSESGLIYEDKGTHSFLYILIGFLNIFIFLISYKRYRVFRQNLLYSLKKPHGFFVNLQERISIPYKQSLFLLLVISLNGAIVYSSLAYFNRSYLLLDYVLSLVFYTPWLKGEVAALIWNQSLFLLVATVGIVLVFYLLALLVKLFSLFGEGRILFNQALAVGIWAAAPFVALLPLGIFLYSLMLEMNSFWILFGLLLYFHVWAYLRWINGIRVLTDRLYWRVFLLLSAILILAAAGIGYVYHNYYNVKEHLVYVYNLYEMLK